MATPPRTRSPWVRNLLRWLVNAALLLGLALALSIVGRLITGRNEESIGDSAAIVVYAWYITTWLFIPGAVLYLLLLEFIPTGWSRRARRSWAIGLSPLIGLMFWFYVVPGAESPAVTAAFVLASGAVYGALAQLRQAKV